MFMGCSWLLDGTSVEGLARPERFELSSSALARPRVIHFATGGNPGTQARIRTEKPLFLRQRGLPIAFTWAMSGGGGGTRTHVAGVRVRCLASWLHPMARATGIEPAVAG